MPWYRIPAAYAADRQVFQLRNGGFVLPGYFWLIRSFAWKQVDSPILTYTQSAPKRPGAAAAASPKV
jgi:fatty acid desaturase